MTELTGTLLPILVSVAVSLVGAWAISRYAGPAQSAYVAALEKRLEIVTDERDEAEREIPGLKARILDLEREVAELKAAEGSKDREIADLYRRLDADERRISGNEERIRRTGRDA